MYTIKQAALRSGVPVPLLRAWERRYGVVTPDRSAGGYRLYDDAAIERLRAMRGLIEGGWSAAQAARAVIAAPPAVRDVAAPASEMSTDLLDAATRYDLAAVEQGLDEMFGRGSFESVIDDLVLPGAAQLGEAWAAGRIDVAAEHLVSGAMSRRLSALFDVGGRPGSGPRVLVGLPPDSRHELGALAFAVALRRLGVDVLYLGSDVPIASWVDAADESGARAAVIGVVTDRDVRTATDVAAALRAARPEMTVAVGGASASDVAEPPDVLVLPERVVEAARTLQARITRRG